jgi:hypothetical protein
MPGNHLGASDFSRNILFFQYHTWALFFQLMFTLRALRLSRQDSIVCAHVRMFLARPVASYRYFRPLSNYASFLGVRPRKTVNFCGAARL